MTLHLKSSNSINNFRIVKTLLNKKPKEQGYVFALLLVLTCAVVSIMVWKQILPYSELASSQTNLFDKKNYYTLFTSLFIHADMQHLLSNSYMLFILSIFVFGNLTPNFNKAFLLLFNLLAGSALVNLLTVLTYDSNTRLVGISGMVYLLAGFWFSVFLFVDRTHKVGGRLLRVVGTGLVILFPTSFEPTTSYQAHWTGLWIGLLMGIMYFYVHKSWIRSFEVVKAEIDDDYSLEHPLSTESDM